MKDKDAYINRYVAAIRLVTREVGKESKDAESFDDLILTQQGDDVLIRHVRGTIRVEDADLGDFDAADFIFS